jgi:hypothetical protein
MSDESQSLVQQHGGLPTPAFTGKQMADALQRYKELQMALDAAMPNEIITLQGRVFRKKAYWRAVSVAFNLNVEMVSEERVVAGFFADERENFGYNVTYRASSGVRSAMGDGSCFAVEKAGKFKCPHPMPNQPNKSVHWPPEQCPLYDGYRWQRLPANASEHNVRSHAHSRAFNRAVSNLCGFGEVSAEEVEQAEVTSEPVPTGSGATPAAQNAPPASQAPRQATNAPAPAQSSVMDGPAYEEPPHPAQAAAQAPAGRRQAPPPAQKQQQQRQQPASRAGAPVISEPQDRRFFAKAMAAGWDADSLRDALKEVWHYDRSDEITKADYNRVVAWVENGPPQ